MADQAQFPGAAAARAAVLAEKADDLGADAPAPSVPIYAGPTIPDSAPAGSVFIETDDNGNLKSIETVD